MKPDTNPLTLGGLIDTLGSQLIHSLTGAIGLDQSVSIPVVYDPLDDLPDIPGGVLLMTGMDPSTADTLSALRVAAVRGFCAIVVKLRGSTPLELVRVAAEIPIAVLSVVDDAPWTHIGNLITAVIRSRSLVDPTDSAAGSDLFVLANAVATAFDGAVAIEDVDRNVLAYSNLEHHEIDPLRRSGILSRQVPDLAKHNEQYRRVMVANGMVRFPFDASDGELPRCAAAVRAGREDLGSIWVIVPEGGVHPDAEAALLEATRLAAVQILQARSSVNFERQVRAEWLRSVFDGSVVVASTATRFGVVPGVASVVVAFLFKAAETGASPPLMRQLTGVIEGHCSVFRANVSCVSIGPIVYVLFPAVRDATFPLRLAQGAAAAVESRLECGVYAALSSPKTGPEHLSDLRHEVDEVLGVLSSAGHFPDIASAGDIQAQMLLLHLKRELRDKPRLRHPGVSALINHDHAKGSEYRASLCAYFAAMGDMAAAAQHLNVHPNTLRYRIKRAETLFGLRLDSADDQLAIWIQLRLAEDHATLGS
ncbi:CdaR family transcriptional regulator [Cryobacterium sp. SO1]|uniref:PucR family transcriptional regulator n=1 Tax=Cryobacterium sp. SO1 TaxID=1897061 RepID=UPI0010CF58DF|nr:PucR family transcriptional regulator [Cryobacterium sp. SO1]RZI34859.1 hypothetical protein BJQ95_02913 [Cryobacterium sp. SO1]